MEKLERYLVVAGITVLLAFLAASCKLGADVNPKQTDKTIDEMLHNPSNGFKLNERMYTTPQ